MTAEEIRAAMLRVIREQPTECLRHLNLDSPKRAEWLIRESGYGMTDIAYVNACELLADWDAGLIVAGQLMLPF